MTSTVATEIAQASPPAKPLLETWGKNERMRHIPPVEWITRKVDVDLRRRVDIACSSLDRLASTEPRRAAAEQALTAVCRALERLADTAKHGRPANPHAGADIATRVRDAMHYAVANLNTIDGSLFGRRHPIQTFERSKAEPVMGALVAFIDALNRAVNILRESDPSIDERLLDGLVTLQTPLRSEPIA